MTSKVKVMNFEQFVKVRETLVTMLIKRGFDPNNININIDENTLKTQFNSAIKDKQFMACDMFIKQSNDDKYKNTKALIHFILDDKSTLKKELDAIQNMVDIYDIKPVDDIVIIIGHETVDELNPFYELDKKLQNAVIFHYKNLSFDITNHKLVPQHIKITSQSEINQIKKNLKIDSLLKLPVLPKTDAISKFYHYRKGDLIKIIRPSIGNFKHEVYRIVI